MRHKILNVIALDLASSGDQLTFAQRRLVAQNWEDVHLRRWAPAKLKDYNRDRELLYI